MFPRSEGERGHASPVLKPEDVERAGAEEREGAREKLASSRTRLVRQVGRMRTSKAGEKDVAGKGKQTQQALTRSKQSTSQPAPAQQQIQQPPLRVRARAEARERARQRQSLPRKPRPRLSATSLML